MSMKSSLTRARKLLHGLFERTADGDPDSRWERARAPLADDDRVMQSHTHAWLRSIPNGLHPKQLCRHYPRVANRIAMAWHELPQVDRLLTDLMVDGRGNRLGFPPRIRHELDRLYGLHARRMTPLLRGRLPATAPVGRTSLDAPRRVRLRSPMSVSSIKR
jgi:hypothetical protein